MREGISIEVSPADCERLAAVVADRNSRQKHVWRAWIILATAEGCGTAEIMRRSGVSNAVEGFFATLTPRRLHRGVFCSLVDLQAAINRYLGEHNRNPKPFVWTADPDRIIEKVNRGYRMIASDN
jgi:hypothetical protein